MAKARKTRPSFDATPVVSESSTPGWAYRSGAEPEPAPATASASAPAAPTTATAGTSRLERMLVAPVALGLLMVLAPVSWLTRSSRRR